MKNRLLTIAIFSLAFSACFSPRQGEEGTLTINLGGSRGVYVPWLETEYELTYVINVDGGSGGPYNKRIPSSGGTALFSLVPGDWNITVEAYKINEADEILYDHLIAVGKDSVTIKPGQNSAVTITLKKPPTEEPAPPSTFKVTFNSNGGTPVPDPQTVDHGGKVTAPGTMTKPGCTFDGWYKENSDDPWDFSTNTVESGITLYARWIDIKIYLIVGENKRDFESLADALQLGQNDLDLTSFTVSIYDGAHLISSNNGGVIDKIVTIENRGNGTASINLNTSLDSKGYIFSVSAFGNLTLQGNITLEGLEDNNSALINVYGTLNINDNVIITGNNNNDDQFGGYGGGVYVGDGGIFNMKGGTISSNQAYYWGGGVYVNKGGTFNMHKGIIHGNKAQNGGGVYVYIERDIGKFYMLAGEISGNEATSCGGGVYIHGEAIFEKEQGTIYGIDEPDDNKKNKDTGGGGADSVYLGRYQKSIDKTVDGHLDNNPEE